MWEFNQCLYVSTGSVFPWRSFLSTKTASINSNMIHNTVISCVGAPPTLWNMTSCLQGATSGLIHCSIPPPPTSWWSLSSAPEPQAAHFMNDGRDKLPVSPRLSVFLSVLGFKVASARQQATRGRLQKVIWSIVSRKPRPLNTDSSETSTESLSCQGRLSVTRVLPVCVYSVCLCLCSRSCVAV